MAIGTSTEILDKYADIIGWADGRDGKIGFLLHDNPIGLSIARYGEWSGIELDYHLNFICEDAVVIDVGANVGTHSLAYANKASQGRVLLFEPQPLLLALALRTLEVNGRSNAQGYSAAVSDKVGKAMFRFPDYGSLGNYGMVSEVRDSISNEDLAIVPTLLIDDLDLDRCDFIKIDAEGATAEVLQGAAQTLSRFRPVIATEVLGIEDGWRIMEWFRKSGCDYTARFYRFSSYNARNSGSDDTNFFGAAEECGLLFLPSGLDDTVSIDGLYTTTVKSLDELAREHERTARYGDFTPFDRKHEVIGSLYVDLLRRMLPVYATSSRTDVCATDEGWSGVHSAMMHWDQRLHRTTGKGAADPGQAWLEAVLADFERREITLTEKNTELMAAMEKVSQRETAGDHREARLNHRENELSEREELLQQRETKLADHTEKQIARERELDDLQVELVKQRTAVELSAEAVTTNELRLALDMQRLSEREELLQQRETKLAGHTEKQIARERELDAQSQLQAYERMRLSQRAIELEELQAKLSGEARLVG
ncbi:MAG: FkbM family methyltransferase [Brevundimonas sp.]|nr:FkbM family methyltransferase [Brevundimonas sp.]